MLFKKYRLTKRNDFQAVFKKGRKSFGNFFSIRYKENGLDYSRIAVVVSAKVSKRAITRNLIKRRVRVVVKPLMSEFSKNFDIIINVMSPTLNIDFNNLQKELNNFLKKNKIL
jgi:ribonuclease P protein component